MIEQNPAAALARIPSGLFILTVRDGDRSTGMLASWVQQAGFEPLTLTVAVANGRYLQEWVEHSGRFVLNQLATSDGPILKHFARGFAADEDAFHNIMVTQIAKGGPVLEKSLGYLDCKLTGQLEAPDHCVYLAEVVGGALLDPSAAPFVHTRRNATHY